MRQYAFQGVYLSYNASSIPLPNYTSVKTAAVLICPVSHCLQSTVFCNVSCLPHRRFATVEHRARSLAGSSYIAVPEENTVLQLLLTELGLSDPDKSYVALRDDCLHRPRSPALELRIEGPERGILWPMLAISQGPLLLACLPLVEAPAEPRPPLASLLSVSQSLTLLAGLQSFLLGSGGKPDSEGLASRLAMLPSVLLRVCPLGTPLDVPLLGPPAAPTAPVSAGSQKQPAWKTGLHRGRAVVNAALTETVRSMQYGHRSRQDLWDVYGTVTCKVRVQCRGKQAMLYLFACLHYFPSFYFFVPLSTV